MIGGCDNPIHSWSLRPSDGGGWGKLLVEGLNELAGKNAPTLWLSEIYHWTQDLGGQELGRARGGR